MLFLDQNSMFLPMVHLFLVCKSHIYILCTEKWRKGFTETVLPYSTCILRTGLTGNQVTYPIRKSVKF